VKGAKKGKSPGIEGSANANDVWVWMWPHIGFCTIVKCDLLSYFISIESLPASCKSHPLFLSLKPGTLQMRFHFCFSIRAPLFLSFQGSFFCWVEIPLIGIF
jgi:hypothetical protein